MPATVERRQNVTAVTRMAIHSKSTSRKAMPGLCSPKNSQDYSIFKKSCIPKEANGQAASEKPLGRQINQAAIAMLK